MRASLGLQFPMCPTVPFLMADFIIAPDKCIFQLKVLIVFLFFYKNIYMYCGYSLEVPWPGASNEYPQCIFNGEIKNFFIWILCLISREM